MNIEYMKPGDIERRSFEIISEILGDKVLDKDREHIIKRCIHTSADFDYADNLYFSKNVVDIIGRALSRGCRIVTDTRMAMAGVNKRAAADFGVEVMCFMADPDVAAEAADRGTTRAAVSMEKAMRLEGPVIFAIGNAPTALIRLYEAVSSAGYKPAGIIAAPVGFVNVVESKELIMQTGTPCIVARGRKGGSNIAAAICNALLYGANGAGGSATLSDS